MREQGIDALVISGAQDWMNGTIRWFTGLPANNGYPRSAVFPAEGLMTVCEQGPVNVIARLDGRETASRGVGKNSIPRVIQGASNIPGVTTGN